MGSALARQTAPISLSNGQLVVAASSPAWAAQARFLVAEIGRAANRELGRDEVRSVRVVVRPEAGR
jgi:predicted nucleic acid-binding Zn ribbon protein